MRILLIIITLWSVVCHGQVGRGDYVKTFSFKNIYQKITKQFARIDSLQQSGGYDSLENENEKVISILNQYRTHLFNFPDTLNYDLIYLTKSADKRFVLVSWDTRTGGTLIAFTTMAIFKTPQGVVTRMLVDTSDESMPYSYMHYNSVNTIKATNGRSIYLAWGNGQGSTALPWQELRAFSIVNGQLIEPKIFPDKMSKIYVEFDLHAFSEKQRVPSIKIKDCGRTIQVPIEGAKQGFSGKYKTYTFNGKNFVAS
jgi:hypothetical protein